MELFLEIFYPETIIIVGLWDSNAFLRYVLIQVSNLRKGIITLMTNKPVFYTEPEAEIFYHTPGKDDTEPFRLNIHINEQ